MSCEFDIYGKWILAGEHAVLRGGAALVFPVLSKGLHVRLESDSELHEYQFSGVNGQDYQLLFPGLVDRALSECGKARGDIHTKVLVESSLPIGAGLGASAALSVLVGKWFHDVGWVGESEIYEFSRKLENLFHGESSGVDIACALHGRGIRFVREQEPEFLELTWKPYWLLTPSGQRGLTSDSVKRVQDLFISDKALAVELDIGMRASVASCEEALQNPNGLMHLKEAMSAASEVFSKWNLVTPKMNQVMSELKEQGAVAVKPTGSGGGGFILSLWPSMPAAEIVNNSISIW